MLESVAKYDIFETMNGENMGKNVMTSEEAFKVVSNVIEIILGHPASEVTKDMVFSTDLNMDDIYSIRFMMKCEEYLDCTLDDTFFVVDRNIPQEKMWKNKTVGEVVDFIVETLNSK